MAQVSREGFERNRTYNYVRRTPEQLDAGRHIGEEPRGLLGSAWDNLWGGMESMVGGAMDRLGRCSRHSTKRDVPAVPPD